MENNNNSDEEYIDINDLLNSQLKNIYQFQINNNDLLIKHIGKGTHIPDIIIKESFGKKQNLSLYNCIYLEDEIDFLKTKIHNDKFLPIIKLVEKINNKNNVYSLSIKINELIVFDKSINNFTIFITYCGNDGYIHHIELEKTINQTNIIEKMLENIIDCGFDIL